MHYLNKKILLAVGAGLLLPTCALAMKLECDMAVEPKEEKARIAERAKGVVLRKGKHDLRVVAAGKSIAFVDKAPYGEDFSGTNYRFCDRKEGFVLVLFTDEDLFTGKLINETTGKVTDAGHDVLFSQDRRAYLAAKQPNGLDGSAWTIFDVEGRQSYSGYSFISHPKKPDSTMAELSAPVWDASGKLSATAECLSNPATKWKVTLTKNAGKWDWSPKGKCPA